MEREKGTLIRWDNDKGFGFIRPDVGNKDIFFHIGSLPHYQRRPKIGDVLIYEVEVDDRGRNYATSTRIKGLAWSRFTLAWGGLLLLFGAYCYLTLRQTLSFHPVAIYAAMSLLTIWAYSHDKRAAQLGFWRTPEIKLHILEALGGWPGALLAQIFYRHKVRKLKYQVVFWLIVLGHGVLWYQVLSNHEMYRPYQQLAAKKARTLLDVGKRTTSRLLGENSAGTAAPQENPRKSRQPEAGSPSLHRSMIAPLPATRRVQGIVKEIRPGEGVVVFLDGGKEGIISKSALVRNFAPLFKKGEQIQVAVQSVTFEGNASRIELILVD